MQCKSRLTACLVFWSQVQVWQQALPTHTIIQIESQAIVTAAGVLHCICMHVPAYDFGSGKSL